MSFHMAYNQRHLVAYFLFDSFHSNAPKYFCLSVLFYYAAKFHYEMRNSKRVEVGNNRETFAYVEMKCIQCSESCMKLKMHSKFKYFTQFALIDFQIEIEILACP